MTYEERFAFLNLIRENVGKDHTLIQDIMRACTEGVTQKLDLVNERRVEAETCLCMTFDMIPESKMKKSPAIASRVKKALNESMAFAGTPFAERLKQEQE